MNFSNFPTTRKPSASRRGAIRPTRCPTSAVRAILEGPEPYDQALWQGLAEMGFLGVVIPEEYGGLGLSYLELCLIAEELGRAIAPVPFSSSVFLATEFLLAAGSEAQKSAWLPKLAAGEAIGTFAFAERVGAVTPKTIQLAAADGRLTGTKTAVPDGEIADFAIVAARSALGFGRQRRLALHRRSDRPRRHPHAAGDHRSLPRPRRHHLRQGPLPSPLASAGEGWSITERVFDRAAVLTASRADRRR